MIMILNTTKVKRTKSFEEQLVKLQALENALKESIKEGNNSYNACKEEYVKIPFIHRHMSDVYVSMRTLRNQIDKMEEQLEYIETLNSDTIYANVNFFTDVWAFEVIKMKNHKSAIIRRLKVDLANPEEMANSFINGSVDNKVQEWTYDVDESQETIEIIQHKNGGWYTKEHGYFVTLSKEPKEFYDFSMDFNV